MEHSSRSSAAIFSKCPSPRARAILTGSLQRINDRPEGRLRLQLAIKQQGMIGATQRLVGLYADPDAWPRKAILNVAGSGGVTRNLGLDNVLIGVHRREAGHVTIPPCTVYV